MKKIPIKIGQDKSGDEQCLHEHVAPELISVLCGIKIQILQKCVHTGHGDVVVFLERGSSISVEFSLCLLVLVLLELEQTVVQCHAQLLNQTTAKSDLQQGVHLGGELLHAVEGQLLSRRLEIRPRVREAS